MNDGTGVCSLKLKHRLLQQQLHLVDRKFEKLQEIVEKKLKGRQHLNQERFQDYSSRKNTGRNYNYVVPPKSEREECSGREVSRYHSSLQTAPISLSRSFVSNHIEPESSIEKSKRSLLAARTIMRQNMLQPSADKIRSASSFKRDAHLEARRRNDLLRDATKTIEAEKKMASLRHCTFRKSSTSQQQKIPPSRFPTRYDRGEVPCYVDHGSAGGFNGLIWDVPLGQLDYEFYIPLFAEGIRCSNNSMSFIAKQGLLDLIEDAAGSPKRLVPCLPTLFAQLRYTLMVERLDLSAYVCQALRALAQLGKEVGKAMVKQLKVILGHLNKHVDDSRLVQAFGKYSSQAAFCVEVEDTLQQLEKAGGVKAFAIIRGYIPSYLSILGKTKSTELSCASTPISLK